jgi:hypothetical protein
MWRSLKRLRSSFSYALKGVNKREAQERIDVHRLFLYTSWHQLEGSGDVADSAAQHLVEEVSAAPSEADGVPGLTRGVTRTLATGDACAPAWLRWKP